jgi:hypothetical protein
VGRLGRPQSAAFVVAQSSFRGRTGARVGLILFAGCFESSGAMPKTGADRRALRLTRRLEPVRERRIPAAPVSAGFDVRARLLPSRTGARRRPGWRGVSATRAVQPGQSPQETTSTASPQETVSVEAAVMPLTSTTAAGF